jgi:vitamin B12 transport system substrate-binding protein
LRFYLLLLCLLTSINAKGFERIVSLSPHLTEWVYSLNQGQNLVGVSAYSNYPVDAQALPQVADYNGVNFTQLMILEPDLILAWQGGNKPQDIAKLRSLGYQVFLSHPEQPLDISLELRQLSELLGVKEQGARLSTTFTQGLDRIKRQYANSRPLTAFYYSWTQPLMSIGKHTWANQVLGYCQAHTLFADSPIDYPQVTLQQVIVRQPDLLIAASTASEIDLMKFWQPHKQALQAPLITVNPDIMSRFTLRLLPEMERLCQQINHTRQAFR